MVHRGLKLRGGFNWDERFAPDDWSSLRLEVEPGRGGHMFETPDNWPMLCSGYSKKACDRMCEVAYGSVQACYDAGRYTPEERGSR